MTAHPAFLRLNHLCVRKNTHTVYDQTFHKGVNIIRGQNGSGKSTIADLIFFVLGGEFSEWKDVASQCHEVQAEVETPKGTLTLKRLIGKPKEPMFVFFGSMLMASEGSPETWERFPIHRHGGNESFSQVMFRSLLIPEAQSEGASNITMHQLLRLCYSDQRTPSARLFRFENFDTQSIREAVGDLICGVGEYETYEVGLELRKGHKQLDDITRELKALQSALPFDEPLDTSERIHNKIDSLEKEGVNLRQQLDTINEHVQPGQVKEYLDERRNSQKLLIKEKDELKNLELKRHNLEFEIREIKDFEGYLTGLKEKLTFAEAMSDVVGSIEFTHCPACGEGLIQETSHNHCVVCKALIDPESEKSKYNRIRLDLEIQARQSAQLTEQKQKDLDNSRQTLRSLARRHKKNLTEYDMRFSGVNGPREAYLVPRIKRLGHIDAEIEFLHKSLDASERVEELNSKRDQIKKEIDALTTRKQTLQSQAKARRTTTQSLISQIGVEILRSDLPRQPEFEAAKELSIYFQNDLISVSNKINFAESSNVILKNTALYTLFLAAGQDPKFNHPRFLLIDNVEDKGMETIRSHQFQRILVDRAANLTLPCQLIFTTSMMNPELDKKPYTIGSAYTNKHRSLDVD